MSDDGDSGQKLAFTFHHLARLAHRWGRLQIALPVQDSPIVRSNDIRWVGTSETAPPIIVEQNGEVRGIEADFARDLAKALGKKVRFVPMYWPNLIYDLREKRIDIIMSGMSVTDERRIQVVFLEPCLVIGQTGLIRGKDQTELEYTEAILSTNRRVGTEKDSIGEHFVQENMRDARHVSFPTLAAATRALVEGRTDVVIHDSPCIRWLENRHVDDGLIVAPSVFTKESLAWAVHMDNTDLLESINRILLKWRETGKVEKLINRWIPSAGRD